MRPTWAEVRLDRIVTNYKIIKDFVGSGVEVMAVVKANAYGHGAVPVAMSLERQARADWFGVALVEEGIILRRAGVRGRILCLGGFWQDGLARDCVEYDLTPTIYRLDMLDVLQRAALSKNQKVKYHVKLDTGMGRLGLLPEQLPEFLSKATCYENIILDGVMTHLACADEPEKNSFTQAQIENFSAALSLIKDQGFSPTYSHISNSAGTHAWPNAYGNLVRTGGLLYGLWRDVIAPTPAPLGVSPAMSLHTRIILLKWVKKGMSLGYGGTFMTERDSLIATLPIGYDDGLRRGLSNNGNVLLHGKYAPIVGRVSMDLTLVDVTEIDSVVVGDEVVVIGECGSNQITAEEVAARIDTISFEITCAISGRVPRVYRSSREELG